MTTRFWSGRPWPIELIVPRMSDGACAIVRGDERHAVVDCGNRGTSDEDASARLLSHLGERDLAAVTEIVVTHWHADHYRGFTALPAWTSPPVVARLTLYLPVLPVMTEPDAGKLLAAFRAMSILSRRDPVDLPAVQSALGTLFTVTTQPVGQGDLIELGGIPFQVLWPPAVWGPPERSRARKAVAAAEKLAERDPHWAEVLDEQRVRNEADILRVEGDGWGIRESERVADLDQSEDVESTGSEAGEVLSHPSHLDFVSPFEADSHPAEAAREDLDGGADLETERRQVGALLSEAANALSLMLYQPQVGLLMPGDATRDSLNSALRRARLDRLHSRRPLSVLLAPHHGTTGLGKVLDGISVTTCICQDGPLNQARPHRTRAHPVCHSTHTAGPIHFA